ncbi:unnamed protein product [Polarella glacialis]|uniref:Uncharacterized protein n=1 Tax=Polarella glacialis TaxID=89957 RepID=A0A813DRN3_POLGL|nr:unnamed protein product [Polarella glacialis]CAE8664497.1 unnamed protein product [Polarella glacialis]
MLVTARKVAPAPSSFFNTLGLQASRMHDLCIASFLALHNSSAAQLRPQWAQQETTGSSNYTRAATLVQLAQTVVKSADAVTAKFSHFTRLHEMPSGFQLAVRW